MHLLPRGSGQCPRRQTGVRSTPGDLAQCRGWGRNRAQASGQRGTRDRIASQDKGCQAPRQHPPDLRWAPGCPLHRLLPAPQELEVLGWGPHPAGGGITRVAGAWPPGWLGAQAMAQWRVWGEASPACTASLGPGLGEEVGEARSFSGLGSAGPPATANHHAPPTPSPPVVSHSPRPALSCALPGGSPCPRGSGTGPALQERVLARGASPFLRAIPRAERATGGRRMGASAGPAAPALWISPPPPPAASTLLTGQPGPAGPSALNPLLPGRQPRHRGRTVGTAGHGRGAASTLQRLRGARWAWCRWRGRKGPVPLLPAPPPGPSSVPLRGWAGQHWAAGRAGRGLLQSSPRGAGARPAGLPRVGGGPSGSLGVSPPGTRPRGS